MAHSAARAGLGLAVEVDRSAGHRQPSPDLVDLIADQADHLDLAAEPAKGRSKSLAIKLFTTASMPAVAHPPQ